MKMRNELNLDSPNTILQRLSDHIGTKREYYIESNCKPLSECLVIPFFGDTQHLFVLSTMLLKQFISKYTIVVSYPGYAGLFPYASEYWSYSVPMHGLAYENNESLQIQKMLVTYLDQVQQLDYYHKYYEYGFQKDYFENFKEIKYNLPLIKAADNYTLSRITGKKTVFISPTKYGLKFGSYKPQLLFFPEDYYVSLVECLLAEGYLPVIWQNSDSFNLSTKFAEKCVYVFKDNILDVIAVMRVTECILSIFSGLKWFSCLARNNCISINDRNLHTYSHDDELEILCADPKFLNIFAFPTLIDQGKFNELNKLILNKLMNFNASSVLPSPGILEIELSYDVVRQQKNKKIGTRFIRREKNEC